jgi:hypothetical protein
MKKQQAFDLLSEAEKITIARQWCEAEIAEGRDVVIEWDGGNDSGCVTWRGDSSENEITDFLVDSVYDELDYGSWAGEYSASGRMEYDSDQQALVGTDYYSEDDYLDLDKKAVLHIPKKYYFDQISYQITDYDSGGDCGVEFTVNVTQGFIDPELEKYLKVQADLIKDYIDDQVKSLDLGDREYLGIDSSESVNYDRLEVDGDNLTLELDVYTKVESCEEKEVVLNLKDEDDE